MGGIAPTLSFRITFSQVSAFAGTFATSMSWRVRPPVLARSLWQVTQYLSSSARWAVCACAKEPSIEMQAIATAILFSIIRTVDPLESYTISFLHARVACGGWVLAEKREKRSVS